MANEHDLYLTSALMGRIQEHIAKAQENLIWVLENRPDDINIIEMNKAIIRELRSLLK